MFIYFIPTNETSVSERVASVLPYAWDKAGAHGPQCSCEFGNGLIAGRKSLDISLLQFGKASDWRKIPGKDAWVKQVAPVTHEGLKRNDSEFVAGDVVEIGNVNWCIPKALAWMSSISCTSILPCYDTLGDDGKWSTGDVLPQYKRLWECVDRIIQGDWDYQEQVNSIVNAFSVHYYVDAIECDMMRVLSMQYRQRVWDTIIDMQGFEQLKKNVE